MAQAALSQAALSQAALSQAARGAPLGEGALGEGALGEGALSYRAAMRVAVTWRQLSEPNDPVWWVDGLPREAFAEGFGLQTPMLSGQLRVVRYFPYCARALALARTLAAEQLALTDAGRKRVLAAQSVAALHEAVGRDFWVVSPCGRGRKGGGEKGYHKSRDENRDAPLEGTRLTIVAKPPRGHEFSIRTPGTPARWRAYERELERCWRSCVAWLAERRVPDERYYARALSFFYYWVSSGALTRGTAATGYAALFALLEAAGRRLVGPLPEGRQLDWEAILRPDPDAFVEAVRDWLFPMIGPSALDLDGLGRVAETFPTARAALQALSEGTEDARPLFDRDLVAMRAFGGGLVP
jgi:hypothetical protein